MKNLIWILFAVIFFDARSQSDIGLAGKQFVALSVSSADSVSAWYEDIFQIKLLKEFKAPDGSGHVRIIGNEHLIVEILQYKNSKSLQDCLVNPEQPFAMQGIFKVAFFVVDITRADKYLRSKDVAVKNSIFEDKETRTKSMVIMDLKKNLIQIIEHPSAN